MKLPLLNLCLLLSFCTVAQGQNSDPPLELLGDLGVGNSYAPTPARSTSPANRLVPYANFDYGNLFGRVDTFGVRTVPFGFGNLELVTRFVEEGYTPAHTSQGYFDQRKSSLPVGIGTLQITPVGGLLLNVFHDLNRSGGNLADMIYAVAFEWGDSAFYPQLGVEYRSRSYVQYFYGISAAEAARTGSTSYYPGNATNPFIDLLLETKISGHWYLNANLRKTWLDNGIADSPLVMRHVNNSGLISLSYRFE